MDNVIQFPEQIRITDFIAEEALKQQIRQCLGCAVGLFHGRPTQDDYLLALSKMDEAVTLMRSLYAVQTHG